MKRQGIRVSVYDPDLGVSLSLTLYKPADVRRAAQVIEDALRRHWKTTSLTDRRHKRR